MSTTVMAGNGLSLSVPDLSSSLDQIAAVLNPKQMRKVYRKGISAGGRILLKKAKELVPNSRVKRSKNSPKGRYGRSGILKKSLKMYYRQGRNTVRPYVVIGSDRDTAENASRGKQIQKEIPSKTIHLVENGFTAVSRISLDGTRAGLVQGSDTKNKVLSLLRGQRGLLVKASSINLKNALEQKLDQKLFASTALGWSLSRRGITQEKVEAYVKGYKRATKTKVAPRKFMDKAAKQAGPAARAKAIEILAAEFERLISIYRVK